MDEGTKYEEPVDAEAVTAALTDKLVGRRIVGMEKRSVSGDEAWSDDINAGVLLLDNGMGLQIVPNRSWCSCGAGDFEIASLAAFDNAITSVQIADDGKDEDDDFNESKATLTITVYAEGASATVATVTGTKGNGCYGRGYSFRVVPA